MARPKKEKDAKCIRQTISIEPEQLKLLVDYCQAEERAMSWVIRQALSKYLVA